ncbi:MAG: aconitase X catalytic domain-containing protein [Anaerolineaceae bacterium]|nr:aconitase X catalytic domain-containing protein [Anaerolineaceae bacterium]
MILTTEQQAMLNGEHGPATCKAMEILAALGQIYDAERMVPVSSVQIAGVSYDNLGEAGLSFLSEMAQGGGRARVLTTLNPAGMDVERWEEMGISPDFAAQQERVIAAFTSMGIIPTCTCTPYLTGNVPHFGESIAWAESSAVCFANSVIGARTNREGGPSALAAALTGYTPAYNLHLEPRRHPSIHVEVEAQVFDTVTFGALGKAIGDQLEMAGKGSIPYITGITHAPMESLKAFCASIATYGAVALFHMPGITPEGSQFSAPKDHIRVTQATLEQTLSEMSDAASAEIDFVSLGCPHLSIAEIARLAELLRGKKVKKTFWITTARPVKQIADRAGYTQVIEESGAIFTSDTCCVVAPIRGRFHALATDSAKACYYAFSKNKMKTLIRSFDDVVGEALK